MIRKVIRILKRHLDVSYLSNQEMDEYLRITSYDILFEQPDYHQLRRLARELITEIRSSDVSKLVEVPDQKRTEDFLKLMLPFREDEWDFTKTARDLRHWLVGYKRGYFGGG